MNNLAIVILNYNTKDLLRKCLKSIQTKKWKHSQETWVVDNASNDGSAEMIRKEFSDVKLIKSDKNRGFAGGNNESVRLASTGSPFRPSRYGPQPYRILSPYLPGVHASSASTSGPCTSSPCSTAPTSTWPPTSCSPPAATTWPTCGCRAGTSSLTDES